MGGVMWIEIEELLSHTIRYRKPPTWAWYANKEVLLNILWGLIKKVVWKLGNLSFQTTFFQSQTCPLKRPSKWINIVKANRSAGSIASILNFKYSISSNPVIPAQAGIHRKIWEALIWKTVSEFQKWIPACAVMTKVGKLRIEDKVIQLYPQNKCKDQYPTQTDGQPI